MKTWQIILMVVLVLTVIGLIFWSRALAKAGNELYKENQALKSGVDPNAVSSLTGTSIIAPTGSTQYTGSGSGAFDPTMGGIF